MPSLPPGSLTPQQESFSVFNDDTSLVLDTARKLSIHYKHGFIDFSHIFVAILTCDCIALEYCKDLDIHTWKQWLENRYPATRTLPYDASVPLTTYAERIIRYANHIASQNSERICHSVHILLALLCMENEVTENFQKRGIVYEDIATAHFENPPEKIPPVIPLPRKRPYAKWELFFLSPSRRRKKAENLYHRVYELFQYKQHDACIQLCEVALSLDPTHPDFLSCRLFSYIGKRDYNRALTLIDEFMQLHPQGADFAVTRAFIYDELKMYEQAAALLDEVLAQQPDEYTALNNRGFNLYRQGKYQEAIPYYEKAIAVNPSFAYPYDNLGFVKYKLGHPLSEVFALIDKALELDKGNSYAYMYKGVIYMEQGNKEEARKNFDIALKYGYTRQYGNDVLEFMKKL